MAELFATAENEDTANEIIKLYNTYLGRDPLQGGIDAWLATGQSIEQIEQGIANSPEAAVFQTFNETVGRDPTMEERDFYVNVNPAPIEIIEEVLSGTQEAQQFQTQQQLDETDMLVDTTADDTTVDSSDQTQSTILEDFYAQEGQTITGPRGREVPVTEEMLQQQLQGGLIAAQNFDYVPYGSIDPDDYETDQYGNVIVEEHEIFGPKAASGDALGFSFSDEDAANKLFGGQADQVESVIRDYNSEIYAITSGAAELGLTLPETDQQRLRQQAQEMYPDASEAELQYVYKELVKDELGIDSFQAEKVRLSEERDNALAQYGLDVATMGERAGPQQTLAGTYELDQGQTTYTIDATTGEITTYTKPTTGTFVKGLITVAATAGLGSALGAALAKPLGLSQAMTTQIVNTALNVATGQDVSIQDAFGFALSSLVPGAEEIIDPDITEVVAGAIQDYVTNPNNYEQNEVGQIVWNTTGGTDEMGNPIINVPDFQAIVDANKESGGGGDAASGADASVDGADGVDGGDAGAGEPATTVTVDPSAGGTVATTQGQYEYIGNGQFKDRIDGDIFQIPGNWESVVSGQGIEAGDFVNEQVLVDADVRGVEAAIEGTGVATEGTATTEKSDVVKAAEWILVNLPNYNDMTEDEVNKALENAGLEPVDINNDGAVSSESEVVTTKTVDKSSTVTVDSGSGNGDVSNGGVTNGGVTNGGVTNGGVTNGGVTNGGVTNGGVTNGGVTNGGVSNGVTGVTVENGKGPGTGTGDGDGDGDGTGDGNGNGNGNGDGGSLAGRGSASGAGGTTQPFLRGLSYTPTVPVAIRQQAPVDFATGLLTAPTPVQPSGLMRPTNSMNAIGQLIFRNLA